jgi:hypothetical protein
VSTLSRLADDCQPYAGIACRAFDDSSAGPQQAFSLRIAHDAECGAVFDGPARVHEFSLAEYLAARRIRQVVEPD